MVSRRPRPTLSPPRPAGPAPTLGPAPAGRPRPPSPFLGPAPHLPLSAPPLLLSQV